MLEHLSDEGQHEFARALDAAVQIDGGDQRLKGIGDDGGAGSAAGQFLPVAQTQVLPQTDLVCHDVQRLFTDDGRPQLGQLPFRHGVVVEQIVRDDDGEHRIAQKFLPLVVFDLMFDLVGIGGVGQRHLQKCRIAKLVVDRLLKLLNRFHMFSFPFLISSKSCGHISKITARAFAVIFQKRPPFYKHLKGVWFPGNCPAQIPLEVSLINGCDALLPAPLPAL